MKILGGCSLLRVCKRAARARRRIHATAATTTSTRLLSSSPISSSEREGAEEGDRREVGVFWDFENCCIPSSLDPFLIRPNIERALRTSGFHGPISLSGYGNIHQVYRAHNLEALSETGVDLHHVPNGGKNSSDRALMIDVLLWTMKHSPPAHVLLISGDSDFSVLLHKLRMLSYNVLLAAPNKSGMSSALVHAASRIWVWPDIATGEGLLGQVHISGTPLPFLVTRNKESGVHKPNTDLPEDKGHVPENVKDPGEDVVNRFSRVSEAGWIPPLIVNRITSIVERCPGISLGEMNKELRSMNLNPCAFGFFSTFQFLMSIRQLETRFNDGISMKDRTRYYLASTDNSTPGNSLACVVHDQLAMVSPPSCGIAAHNESSDGVGGNEKPELKATDAKGSAKKGISGQKKSPEAGTRQSWVSRLFTLFKGS